MVTVILWRIGKNGIPPSVFALAFHNELKYVDMHVNTPSHLTRSRNTQMLPNGLELFGNSVGHSKV